ncbi:unnamed protein product [Mesocestoides corti]|uniref:Uncharacterized protein n=1 Tax=Mesocestoides corti TaxID=53468 RepID=A0A0R3U191_MESCO|nr:unnamed protein product [Mesocestoides corti]
MKVELTLSEITELPLVLKAGGLFDTSNFGCYKREHFECHFKGKALSGVNAGFQDSEALLSRHQDLTQPTPAAMTFVEENEGENANNTAMGASVSRLSCLAIPHRDSPPTEYRATPQ